MTIFKTPPASETPRSAHAQSPHKPAMIAVAKLFLAIGLILAGGPAATAALTSSMSNHIPPASNQAAPSCGGETPGFCPNPAGLPY
jgi:hypothetical protein